MIPCIGHATVYIFLLFSWMLQAFQKLLQSGRLNPQDVDVEPYMVDDVSYLAKLDTPPL